MEFHVGDSVIHWVHGLGKIVGLEERALAGKKTLYYVVQIQDLTVCVPADKDAPSRLRFPTSEREFKKLFVILKGPGETLSDDRHERKTQLHQKLEDGRAEAVCQVIRDLFAYEQRKSLNDDDKHILKRAWDSLLGEWGYSFSMPAARAEVELRRLLKPASVDAVV